MRIIKSLTFLFFVSLISPSFAETFYLDCVLNNYERVISSSNNEKNTELDKNFRKNISFAFNEFNQSGSVIYDGVSRKFENASFKADEIRIWEEINAPIGKMYTQYLLDRKNGTVNYYDFHNDFKKSKITRTNISGSCKKSKKKNMF